ncbi:MAG: hypothetical protein AAF961_18470, partial [Planctomycetota bacterium]
TELFSTELSTGVGQLRFEAFGNRLRMFFDDQWLAEVEDSSIRGEGAVGVRSGDFPATLNSFTAAAFQQNEQTLPFEDAFDQDDGPLEPSWIERSGTLVVRDNRLQSGFSQLAAVADVNGVAVRDVVVSADIEVQPNGGESAGLVLRHRGLATPSYYLANVRGSSGFIILTIWKIDEGDPIELSTVPLPSGVGRLRFAAEGDSLEVYFQGVLAASAEDGTIPGTGRTGVRIFGPTASIDNFHVTQEQTNNQTLPFEDAFDQPTGSLNDAWGSHVGGFLVVEGGRLRSAVSSVSLSAVHGISVDDVSLAADVDIGPYSGDSLGLVARHTGSTNSDYYLADVFGAGGAVTASLKKNVDGVLSTIASAPLTSGVGALRLVVVGQS